MLREIAEADYGRDAEAHLKALCEIKSEKNLSPMAWEPQEVLELTRWSEPDDPTWEPGSVGIRGHWMRLFSCAVLIRAAGEPQNDDYITSGEDSTIIQFVASALTLGHDVSLKALRFLCWRMRYRLLDDWDRPYFAVATLLLCVALGKHNSETLHDLMAATYSDEIGISALFGECLNSQTWKDITRRILIEPSAASLPIPLNSELKKFGVKLISGPDGAYSTYQYRRDSKS